MSMHIAVIINGVLEFYMVLQSHPLKFQSWFRIPGRSSRFLLSLFILKETQWMDIHSCLIHIFDADMYLHMVGMLGLITETVLTSMAADAFFHNRHHERLPSRSIDPHTPMWFYEITFTLVEMEVEMVEGWRPMSWLGMVPCTRMPSWWRTRHSTSRLYLESSQSHQRRSKKHLWAILQ